MARCPLFYGYKLFSLMFFHSPPSQSVHGLKQIDMAQHQRELKQDDAVHISGSHIHDMLKDTFEDMTSKLTETFELRLQSFKRELVQEQSSFMESAVKKFKSDPYIFKSNGNKRQFQHQEKLMENLMEVSHAILKKDKTTALQKAEEGMTLMRNRMKLIKIADRSQLGWEAADARSKFLGGGRVGGLRICHPPYHPLNFQGKVKNFFHPTLLKIRFKIIVTPPPPSPHTHKKRAKSKLRCFSKL